MMGICEEIDEKYMDAVTAVSGSGPGYMSIIIEAMTYAGLKVGLPRNIALNLCSPNRHGQQANLSLTCMRNPQKSKI